MSMLPCMFESLLFLWIMGLPVLQPHQRDTVPQSRASHFNLCAVLPSSVRMEVWNLFAFVYWKSRTGATTTFFFKF